MAFDRTNQAHLTALKGLVVDNGVDHFGSTQVILDFLNLPANNPTPSTGPDRMTAEALLRILFTENVSAGNEFKLQLLFEGTQQLSDDLSRFKADVIALENGLAAKIAALLRDLSAAETLFAVDDSNGVREFITISRNDWFAARDNG